MAFLDLKHVSIKGVAASAPRSIECNQKIYTKWGGVRRLLFHCWDRKQA